MLCLLGSWVIVFGIISRGVKSSGKASYFLGQFSLELFLIYELLLFINKINCYFLALFPYFIMITLLIRAVTLEGAVKGIIFFLTPQWHELSNPKVIFEFVQKLCFLCAVISQYLCACVS